MLEKKHIGAVVAAGLLAVGTAVVGALPASGATTLPVTAYQEEGDATSVIDASAAALSRVGVDGVNINSQGTKVTSPSSDARAQLARAHSLGLKADLLIGNFSESLGDFDEAAANRMLSSTANINAVVSTLSSAVASQGWDAVTIDLESLQARDTAGLTKFATALKKALPAGKTVGIDVTTFTSLDEFAQNGYDLTGLGKAVDTVALMAYDEHGFGDSGPGPVGELSWQKRGLDLLLSKVPANKVDLGVAGYGYAWSPNGDVKQVGDKQARDMVSKNGATARYDTTAGEWTATLGDGTVLWWSDARSLAARRTLAANEGVHGLAVWDLGLSDTITS
ncbi:glycosyl hydrolase family 18 protein [Streptomyces sp. NPDC046197]|uniref:glycosyl hydrolase family 18 protein n=1 Tax=Streptomyces sp. NPDC046197 TaxID=3154337 RepID=UPI0033F2FAD2